MVGPPGLLPSSPRELPCRLLHVTADEPADASAVRLGGLMCILSCCSLPFRMEKHWQQEYDKDSRKCVPPHQRDP